MQIFVNINMVWQAAMQMTLLLRERESADCNEVNTIVRFCNIQAELQRKLKVDKYNPRSQRISKPYFHFE